MHLSIVLAVYQLSVFFTDLCGYVRSLLSVEGDIFNVKPIAKLLKAPDELMNDVVMKSWKDEERQLETILQHWKKHNVVEDRATLGKVLGDLKQEG